MTYKFSSYLLFIFNILFLSVISISLYKILCRPDLDIFFFSLKNLSLFSTIFYYKYISCCTLLLEHKLAFFFFINNNFFLLFSIKDFNLYFFCYLSIYTISYYLVNISYWNYFSLIEIQNYNYLIEIRFFTKVNSFTYISFYCLQDNILLISNDTTLVFFRISTFRNQEVSCIVIFLVSPSSLITSLVKLQCFCFDNIYISLTESIELPVIFNVDFSLLFFHINKVNLLFFYLLIEK